MRLLPILSPGKEQIGALSIGRHPYVKNEQQRTRATGIRILGREMLDLGPECENAFQVMEGGDLSVFLAARCVLI
jgi:hypothetical protein